MEQKQNGAGAATKKCAKCGRDLPLERFAVRMGYGCGRARECKDCMNARSAQARAKRRSRLADCIV